MTRCEHPPAYESRILGRAAPRRSPKTRERRHRRSTRAPRALNRKQQWREWSGYYAASVYADFHDIEYNAIREAAALIDVSPLFKYVGPRSRRARRSSTASSPAMRPSSRSARSTTRRGATSTARSSTTAPSTVSARPSSAGPRPTRSAMAAHERRRPRRRDRGGHRVAGRARAPGPAEPRRPRGRQRRVVRRPALLPSPHRARIGADRRRCLPHRLHRRPGLRAVGPGREGAGRLGRAA